MQFCSRAQAGLEYLMTYGWALVLIITVASVLFFVFSPSSGEKVNFSLSNNKQILFKAGNVTKSGSDYVGELTLQNASGGTIRVTKVEPSTGASFYTSSTITLNGLTPSDAVPVIVSAGQQMKIAGFKVTPGTVSDGIKITYTDKDGYTKTAAIQGSGSTGSSSGGGAQGQPCTGSGQGNCQTNLFCVDGYCCNTTCTGTCQACSIAGSLGTCSNVNSTQGNCVTDGACSGSHQGCNMGACTTPTYSILPSCSGEVPSCSVTTCNSSCSSNGCANAAATCSPGLVSGSQYCSNTGYYLCDIIIDSAPCTSLSCSCYICP